MKFRDLIFVAAAGVLAIVSSTAMANKPGSENCPVVRMTTSMGDIDIEVYSTSAPATAENFLQYVSEGFYDGLVFHRVIPNFVIQGGGFEPGMTQRANRSPIKNEADNGLKNAIGTLSMARSNEPHSASSQFFINLNDNESLDHRGKNPSGWGYAVFGRVVAGMDVVSEIAVTETTTAGPFKDVPASDIIIEKAEILSPE